MGMRGKTMLFLMQNESKRRRFKNEKTKKSRPIHPNLVGSIGSSIRSSVLTVQGRFKSVNKTQMVID